jgi:hypothetical protein
METQDRLAQEQELVYGGTCGKYKVVYTNAYTGIRAQHTSVGHHSTGECLQKYLWHTRAL